jgi:hypothetical protein
LTEWGDENRCIWDHERWPCEVARIRDGIAHDLMFHYSPKSDPDEWRGIMAAAKIISTKEEP